MSDWDKVVISFTFYLLHLTVTGVMISLVQHILEWGRRGAGWSGWWWVKRVSPDKLRQEETEIGCRCWGDQLQLNVDTCDYVWTNQRSVFTRIQDTAYQSHTATLWHSILLINMLHQQDSSGVKKTKRKLQKYESDFIEIILHLSCQCGLQSV